MAARRTVEQEQPDGALPPLLGAHYGTHHGKRLQKGERRKIDWYQVEDLDPKIALHAVEYLQILVRKALSARNATIEGKEKPDFPQRIRAFVATKRELDEVIKEGGLSLEKAHREYLGYVRLHARFTRDREEAQALERRIKELERGVVEEAKAGGRTHLERKTLMARRQKTLIHAPVDLAGVSPEELMHVFPEGYDIAGELQRLREDSFAPTGMGGRVFEASYGGIEGKIKTGRPTEELRKIFREKGPDLAGDATVRDAGGGRWEVSSGGKVYRLERDGDRLVVSEKGFLDSHDIALLEREKQRRIRDSERLWGDPMVKYLEKIANVRIFVQALERGEEVLELPYTITKLNEMAAIERDNPHSTIGGVVVGEPGVGKTTAVRYYIAATGRSFAYMDLSKEITRFQLFGSKSVSIDNPLKTLQDVYQQLDKMPDGQVEQVIRRGIEKYGTSFAHLAYEAAPAAPTDGSMTEAGILKGKERLKRVIEERMSDVLADEIFKAGKTNGWHYGFAIDCLKRRILPIFDEFNKAPSLSMLHGLMTAQPASDEEAGPMPDKSDETVRSNPRGWYYFADANEWIRVPEDWRMYFTGNVGSMHQVYAMAPAMRSRMEGKVVYFDYPPLDEEMVVTHSLLCDPDLEFRAPYGVAEGLRLLLAEIFPKVRGMKGAERPHPISLRTIHDICGMLYDRSHEVSKSDTLADLDKAVVRVVLDVYRLDEKKDMPRTIIDHLVSAGLLLSPEVEEEVISWRCDNPNNPAERVAAREELEKLRKQHQEGGTFEKLHDYTRISAHATLMGQLPPGFI